MATQLQFPTSPQSPKTLLALAMKNGFHATSNLLVTSVLGSWLVSMVSYLVLNYVESPSIAVTVNLAAIFLIIFFALVGVVQLNHVYQAKPANQLQAYQSFFKRIIPVAMMLIIFIGVLLAVTWFSGALLQRIFHPGSMALGMVRILFGLAYIYFIVALYLMLPLLLMTDKSVGRLTSELMQVCFKHWLRCFLCFFVWLIVIDLLAGNMAFVLVPTLAKIAYSMIIVKTIVAVVALPVLISYTTLLAHDIDLRAH
jgi:hypothetical protein